MYDDFTSWNSNSETISFSHMKVIKSRLRNQLSDENLGRLLRIALEGPELELVDFNANIGHFKQSNRRIKVYDLSWSIVYVCIINIPNILAWGELNFRGGNPRALTF